MLQIDIKTYASDALEDAMRLAQTKALNSYTFSDCLNYLNYAWSDIYNRVAGIDDGYYGVNMQITQQLTKLPAFVQNTLQVYTAQSPIGNNRQVYRASGPSDMASDLTYKLSGNELFVPDATRRTVWLYFVPACPQIFFTHHNRDPKIYDAVDTICKSIYNLYELKAYHDYDEATEQYSGEVNYVARPSELVNANYFLLQHRVDATQFDDITEQLTKFCTDDDTDGKWVITYLSCEYPYIFVSYRHSITGEYVSGFYDKTLQFNEYNPFDFTGKNSNVEYVQTDWNDKTGMGVIIKDYNDHEQFKELGWTPDTILTYPAPVMYRYLVARLADKFAALNESDIMGVQKELVEAKYAFEAFLHKDKSSFQRIVNVNRPTIGDWL